MASLGAGGGSANSSHRHRSLAPPAHVLASIFTSKPPPHYVPGIGRGASGFTTRSDIGPAAVSLGGAGAVGQEAPADAAPGQQPVNDGAYNAALGNDGGLLAKRYDDDDEDKEADAIYQAIDAKLADRRQQGVREQKIKDQIEQNRKDNPKITEQFADLKRRLKDVTEEQWEAIPDASDLAAKRQRKNDTTVAMPDTLLRRALEGQETNAHIDPTAMPGAGAGGGGDGATDLKAVGEGRQTMLGMKLAKLSDNVSGQTTIDPKGYLTSLSGMHVNSEAEVSDIKKARLLLKSVINTNPGHAPGWIAAARLEETAGKMSEARRFALTGTEKCPKSDDVWIEAARLHPPDTAKAILARGVAANPDSISLWLAAADLEPDTLSKQRVLRRALMQIPTSVKLWKASVDLSSEEDARLLLTRAVECCPQHTELWLALASLETYEAARGVLNRARAAVPTELSIWIAASELEEANGNGKMCGKIISRAIKSLASTGTAIDRDTWLREAEKCEKSKSPATCRAIVFATLGMGVEEIDRQRTWSADAEDALGRSCPETARSMLLKAIEAFPGKVSLWRQLVKLEKACGTATDEILAILTKSVSHCPQAVVLWLMAAKERWLGGGQMPPSAEAVDGARAILQEAHRHNADSEDIILAAHKIELDSGEHERARILLARSRDRTGLCSMDGTAKSAASGGSERIYIKSALAERMERNHKEELSLLTEGLGKFPKSWKMWLMKAQALRRGGGDVDGDGDVSMLKVEPGSSANAKMDDAKACYERARAALQQGVKQCPHSIPLWLASADLEFDMGFPAKGRALLEQARLKNPKEDRIWYLHVQRERKLSTGGDVHAAEKLMAQALQECPESGLLWSAHIGMAPRQVRKSRCADALKRCDKDVRVIGAVARLFWADGKLDKARSWLTRATSLAPDDGDTWVLLYRFEQAASAASASETSGASSVIKACTAASPKHGIFWTRVSKDPELWEWDASWKSRVASSASSAHEMRIERTLELASQLMSAEEDALEGVGSRK
ncbi:hypothetical protein PPROV_000801600 [Pycnococcus provasolii]|uniref:PRP1 splicing factor N-terminal domain-containing protein n=1 Tax=Pycnococcus provasolii TaxID=41880 RepID=A0A830HWM1_9CHLO|nr:hypothetical protein PPROV_000801600 [Pycnococcus provasolii]